MKIRLLLFSLLCSLGLFASANAQIPRTISYQGVLADATGTVVPDGSHTLTLKLYTTSSGGSAIYTETQGVGTVKGNFNVLIGSITPIPGSLAFDQPYFLGITVDGGAELAPRTALSSAPYSMNSAHAQVADGLSASATGVVTSVNAQSGGIVLQGGGGTTITNVGNTFTISSSGGGGTGIQGVQNADPSISVTNPNGPTASIGVAIGGITTAKIADGAVTASKIDGSGTTSGFVLTSNGTIASWQAAGGGLTLPFTGTASSATGALQVTNSGAGEGIIGIHSAATGTGAGVKGETNSTDANAVAVLGTVSSTTPGGFSAAVKGVNNGTGGLGVGVSGSQAGSGWGVYGTAPSGIGVYGLSTSGFGVYGQSTSGVSVYGIQPSNGTSNAGFFQNTNAANSSNALEVSTNGTGNAIHGTSTITTGSAIGILGEAASTGNGIGATGGVTGVQGKVTPTSPGGYSAGVRGINSGTGGTGIGVIGFQAGSGWGVYGETPSGFGVYGLTTNTTAVNSGVRGETFSPNGIGVEAKYSGSNLGVALEVDNGAIRVAGTNKACFIHTATAANKLSANGTDITNPMCDGDANCLLVVTQKLNPTGIVYNNSPIGVYYNTVRNKWEIFNENNAAIPNNAQFIVLVIKQ